MCPCSQIREASVGMCPLGTQGKKEWKLRKGRGDSSVQTRVYTCKGPVAETTVDTKNGKKVYVTGATAPTGAGDLRTSPSAEDQQFRVCMVDMAVIKRAKPRR